METISAVAEPSVEERMAAAYRDGASLRDVASAFGTTPYRVRRALDECDVPVRSGYRERARSELPAKAEEIARRYEAGEDLRALGRAYGVTHERIRQSLIGNGVALRPPVRTEEPPTPEQEAQMRQMHDSGASMHATHRALKRSPKWLERHASNAGIDTAAWRRRTAERSRS